MVKRVVILSLSAVVTASGILFPSVWYLCFIGIVPTLWQLSDPGMARRERLLLGWVFGVAYTLTASYCMFWPTLPLDWIGISNLFVAGLLVGFLWLSLGVMVASPFAVFALLLQYSPERTLARVIYVASAWTLVQYLQMWCYALATFSTSSVFGPHISSLMVGYALASFSPLLQLAALGGVYALTFAVAGMGALAYEVISCLPRHSHKIGVVAILCAFLSLATFLDGRYFLATSFNTHLPAGTARLALVSTAFKNSPQTVKEQHENAVLEVATIRDWVKPTPLPAAVILPEDSEMLAQSGLSARAFMITAFGTTSVGLIDSAASSTAGKKYVRMSTYGPGGQILGTYDKIFLIAFGEYIPWLYSSLLGALHNEALNEAIATRSVHNGSEVSVADMGAVRFGSLFCMEIMSPDLYRRLTLSGANVLTNSLSQSWFHGSAIMDRYTMSLAKVRAVENARYLVIAGNEFRSTVISDQGRVISRDPGEGFSVLTVDVSLVQIKTLYVLFGDRLLIVPLIFVCAYLAWRRYHLQFSR